MVSDIALKSIYTAYMPELWIVLITGCIKQKCSILNSYIGVSLLGNNPMMDLTKTSHQHYAQSYYARTMSPTLTRERRDLYLDLGNREEMRGNYTMADEFRRLAVSMPLLT